MKYLSEIVIFCHFQSVKATSVYLLTKHFGRNYVCFYRLQLIILKLKLINVIEIHFLHTHRSRSSRPDDKRKDEVRSRVGKCYSCSWMCSSGDNYLYSDASVSRILYVAVGETLLGNSVCCNWGNFMPENSLEMFSI